MKLTVMKILGIDQALYLSGACFMIYRTSEGIVDVMKPHVIDGDDAMPDDMNKAEWQSKPWRREHILNYIDGAFDNLMKQYKQKGVEILVREGYAFTKNWRSLSALAEVGGILNTRAYRNDFRQGDNFYIIPGPSWRKSVTGKGNSPKTTVMTTRMGKRFEFVTDDEADAFGLAYFVARYLHFMEIIENEEWNKIEKMNFKENEICTFLEDDQCREHIGYTQITSAKHIEAEAEDIGKEDILKSIKIW